MPKVVGGISTSLNYKDFYLDATIDFRIGGDVLNLPYQYMTELGILDCTLDNRDASRGGLTWYADGNDLSDPSKRHLTDQPAGSTVNGNMVYDNGVIQRVLNKTVLKTKRSSLPVNHITTNTVGDIPETSLMKTQYRRIHM